MPLLTARSGLGSAGASQAPWAWRRIAHWDLSDPSMIRLLHSSTASRTSPSAGFLVRVPRLPVAVQCVDCIFCSEESKRLAWSAGPAFCAILPAAAREELDIQHAACCFSRAAAGGIAQTIVFPIDLAKTRCTLPPFLAPVLAVNASMQGKRRGQREGGLKGGEDV
jgi:hypothetical protein